MKFSSRIDDLVSNFDAMWTECIYVKKPLAYLNTYFSYYLTGNLDNSEVVLGKDNWLFYSTTMDGAPLDDYEGKTTLSQEQKEEIYEGVARVQSRLEEKGRKFALIVPPNKEQVYSEYMPSRYHQAETSLTDELLSEMEARGLSVVNPKQVLIDAKKDYQVYYKYDTHWNQLGAYLGAAQALAKMGVEIAPLEEQNILSEPLTPIRHYCAGEDLATIVSMNWPYEDDLEYVVESTEEPDWGYLAVNQEINLSYNCYENPNAPNDATVLLVGDSFRSSMLPVLMSNFSKVYVIMLANFTMSMPDWSEADYVIWECVERRSYLLAEGCLKLVGH